MIEGSGEIGKGEAPTKMQVEEPVRAFLPAKIDGELLIGYFLR